MRFIDKCNVTIKLVDSWYDGIEITFYFYGTLPKTLVSNHKKNFRPTSIQRLLQNTLSVYLKMVIKNKNLGKHHSYLIQSNEVYFAKNIKK